VKLTRRRLIQLSSVGFAALAASKHGVLAAATRTDEVRDNALRFFGGRNFVEMPPLGMITDATFNGGLRYDETRPDPPAAPAVTVQTAARIDDIAEKGRPGVLAAFTLFGIGIPAQAGSETVLSHVMDFLVGERNLDPRRMLFVSTEQFRPLVGQIDGVPADLFFERTLEEAMAAGDGSGFFAPAGHPHSPSCATVGVYYRIPGVPEATERSYPPEGYMEIAEVGIAPSSDPNGPQLGGIGVERVAMAEGEEVPDFEETKLNLLRIIEDEAARTGKDLPPGYTKFASL